MTNPTEAEVEAAADAVKREWKAMCDEMSSPFEPPITSISPTNKRLLLAALTAAAQVREPPARDTDRESLAMVMMRHGFATGHGDTVADLIGELDAQLTEQQTASRAQPDLMPIYGATEVEKQK